MARGRLGLKRKRNELMLLERSVRRRCTARALSFISVRGDSDMAYPRVVPWHRLDRSSASMVSPHYSLRSNPCRGRCGTTLQLLSLMDSQLHNMHFSYLLQMGSHTSSSNKSRTISTTRDNNSIVSLTARTERTCFRNDLPSVRVVKCKERVIRRPIAAGNTKRAQKEQRWIFLQCSAYPLTTPA